MLEVDLRPIDMTDLSDVARIHVAAFPTNVYSRLGTRLVVSHFRWHLTQRTLVYANGAFDIVTGAMLGYCFGGLPGEPTSSFARSHKSLIVRSLLRRPQLLTHPMFRTGLGLGVRQPGNEEADASQPDSDPTVVHAYEIFSLAVDPREQNRGLGKRLMRDQEAYASRQGFASMVLRAPIENAATVAFYERLGYHKVNATRAWEGRMTKALDWSGAVDG